MLRGKESLKKGLNLPLRGLNSLLRGINPPLRGALAEIDLRALASNLKAIKSLTGRGLPVIAVVKADAYGHGAVEVSKTLVREGVHALAVAFCSEAVALRESGIKSPIIVLFDGSDIKSFFDLGLTPVLHDLRSAKAFSREAGRRNTIISVHLKADTGMGRMGFGDAKDILRAAELPNMKITGLMSHLSEADLPDADYSKEQLARFLEIKKALNKMGLRPLCHMANSSAIINLKEAHLDAVRPGLMLYGWDSPPFKPVMEAKAPVLALKRLKKGSPVSYGRTFITTRDTVAAILAVGYADGYSRALSNNSYVIFKGRRAPVIGRVCMDLTIADVTDIKGLREGDMATLIGPKVTAWELARRAGTIPYEILSSIGSRAGRTYING